METQTHKTDTGNVVAECNFNAFDHRAQALKDIADNFTGDEKEAQVETMLLLLMAASMIATSIGADDASVTAAYEKMRSTHEDAFQDWRAKKEESEGE